MGNAEPKRDNPKGTHEVYAMPPPAGKQTPVIDEQSCVLTPAQDLRFGTLAVGRASSIR
jgi:hypothetical protein